MTAWEPAASWKACNAPVLCSLFLLGTCPRELHGCESPSPRHPLSSLLPAGLIICKTQVSLQCHFLQLFSSLPWCLFFRLVKTDLGLILCISFSASFVFWLHILANSRYPTNACSMNELRIKDVSWKYCGSELSKVILKLLQKGTRAIPSRSEILLGKDLLEQSGIPESQFWKSRFNCEGLSAIHSNIRDYTHRTAGKHQWPTDPALPRSAAAKTPKTRPSQHHPTAPTDLIHNDTTEGDTPLPTKSRLQQ